MTNVSGKDGTNGGIVYGPNSTGAGGSSVYDGYGAGGVGAYNATSGGNGYVKIAQITGKGSQ